MFQRVTESIRRRPVIGWLALIGIVVFGGVAVLGYMFFYLGQDEEIESAYGRRSGSLASRSVNGTAVLGQLFAGAGHSVRTKRLLTDAMMNQCDVIVWAPDDFEPPADDVLQWFDEWFATGDRTLIYIGRDFDAAIKYYDKVIPTAPAEKVAELIAISHGI